MKTYLIRGVPQAVQRDGWWLNGATPRESTGGTAQTETSDTLRAGLLLALIALGDDLVWQVMPGLSLAVFAALLVIAALLTTQRRLSARTIWAIGAGTMLVVLPLIELVQPLSILIGGVGLTLIFATLAGLRSDELARGALRLWPIGTMRTISDAGAVFPNRMGSGWSGAIEAAIKRWFVPLALGGVFVILLLQANPIAEGWTLAIADMPVALPSEGRLAFWALLILLIWPVLKLTILRERLRAAPAPAHMGPKREGLINPASVTRALVLFNALFAIQTVLDAVYLYGGAGLPSGLTYAEYAHRGAYPLLITALLAGGFALLTRRWVADNKFLRGLLMLWVLQNVALVISSLVRLELYVEVYGLTHLRLAAAIWMALVAAGLILILGQIWKTRDSGWLLARAALLASLVLYLCSLYSFDAAVARYNLNNPVPLDRAHLCALGDAARPVIAAAEQGQKRQICPGNHRIDVPQDWREWGFRNWRARRSLAAVQAEAAL